MSIISAGTTVGTALVNTGDTTGTLQLQINGTTPAVTLNASGALGVGSTPGYGTSGQVLTSSGTAGAPAWATVNPQSGAAKTSSYGHYPVIMVNSLIWGPVVPLQFQIVHLLPEM